MKRTHKTCPDCKQEKAVEDFITAWGVPNPRAKYCRACFDKHNQEHAKSLLDGRDFCLYCGTKITKYNDFNPDMTSARHYIEQDHMDPQELGGGDEGNLVGCCPACNSRKKDMPFVEWLEQLTPEYRELSRQVYFEKHGHPPEEFVPFSSWVSIEIGIKE